MALSEQPGECQGLCQISHISLDSQKITELPQLHNIFPASEASSLSNKETLFHKTVLIILLIFLTYLFYFR